MYRARAVLSVRRRAREPPRRRSPRWKPHRRHGAAHYRKPGWFTRHVFNQAIVLLTRAGISVWGSRELRVRGRTSGEWRKNPVNLLEHEGRRYLVAPRGDTQWVRNLRVAGTGELRVGRRVEAFRGTELADDDKVAVLRAYLRRWKMEVGVFFDGVGPDASDDELRAIADRHPVFLVDRIVVTQSVRRRPRRSSRAEVAAHAARVPAVLPCGPRPDLVDSSATPPISRAHGGRTGNFNVRRIRARDGAQSSQAARLPDDPNATIAELRGLVAGARPDLDATSDEVPRRSTTRQPVRSKSPTRRNTRALRSARCSSAAASSPRTNSAKR